MTEILKSECPVVFTILPTILFPSIPLPFCFVTEILKSECPVVFTILFPSVLLNLPTGSLCFYTRSDKGDLVGRIEAQTAQYGLSFKGSFIALGNSFVIGTAENKQQQLGCF